MSEVVFEKKKKIVLFVEKHFLFKMERGSTSELPPLGDPMKAEFALAFDQDVAFCNHGSYGAVPKRVLQKRYFQKRGSDVRNKYNWLTVVDRYKC